MNPLRARRLLHLCVPVFLTACPSDDGGSDSGQSGTETTTSSTGSESMSTTGSDTDSATGSTTAATDGGSSTGGATDGSTGGSTTGGNVECGPPVELGTYAPSDGDARGFAVVGDTLYVAGAAGGLFVADIGDPGAPVELGFVDLGVGEMLLRVVVAEDHAFIGMRGSGWSVIDVSDPETMAEVAFDEDVDAQDIAVADNVMYVPDNTGLLVYDVSDPTSPTPMTNDLTLAGSTETVVVIGDTAYVGSVGAGLLIVDVSDPSAPAEVGHYDVSGNGFVAVDDAVAFVSTTDGMHIVDISDPSSPAELSGFGDRAHGVAAAGGRAFMLGDDTASVDVPFLTVVDVEDPTAPTEVVTAFETLESPSWIGFAGDRLVFSAEDDDAVHIIDPCPPAG